MQQGQQAVIGRIWESFAVVPGTMEAHNGRRRLFTVSQFPVVDEDALELPCSFRTGVSRITNLVFVCDWPIF